MFRISTSKIGFSNKMIIIMRIEENNSYKLAKKTTKKHKLYT